MKTIFITGASSGIGKSSARLFQSKGWRVIATMRKPEEETELSKLRNVTILPLDITDTKQIKSTVQSAISLGSIDVILNNAGYGLFGAMEALNDEQIVQQVNTNLLGTMRVTQAFIPYFRERKNGMVLNITSIAGLVAFPFSSIYHATKWGLEGWSESLSIELAPFNIIIKTIAPGGTKTDFSGRSLDLGSDPIYDEMIQKTISGFSTPSTPEEIAAVIYEATTDGKDQLRYLAGETAEKRFNQRLELGAENFRKEIKKWFLNLQNN